MKHHSELTIEDVEKESRFSGIDISAEANKVRTESFALAWKRRKEKQHKQFIDDALYAIAKNYGK